MKWTKYIKYNPYHFLYNQYNFLWLVKMIYLLFYRMSWTWINPTKRQCLHCPQRKNGRFTAAKRRWVEVFRSDYIYWGGFLGDNDDINRGNLSNYNSKGNQSNTIRRGNQSNRKRRETSQIQRGWETSQIETGGKPVK